MVGLESRRRPASWPALRRVFLLALLVGSAAVGGARPVLAGSPLPTWTGSVSLYRSGVFTTQQSWLWCTAADVQIARNISHGERDHTASGQRRYFDWMRNHNRYDLPLSAGVDPNGWAAGMREFVDDRYRLVASATFDSALRLAVKRLRMTGLPVALAVAHGNHGWLLTGFTATADPAASDAFETTSVRVVGPLAGLQSKDGYDMAPNTRLTPTQLRRFFTAWWYDPMRMIWDGQYVSIQPVPAEESPDEPGAPTPTGPEAAIAPPSVAGSPGTPAASPGTGVELAVPSDLAAAFAIGSPAPPSATPDAIPVSDPGGLPALVVVLAALSVAVAALATRGAGVARRRGPG
jgi:hypothetical protein